MAIRQPKPSEAPERSPYDGKRMTEAEYLALPEQEPGLEYWDGVVLQKYAGDLNHGRLQALLTVLLYLYEQQRGGWTVSDIRTRFAGHGYLLPDIAYWAPDKGSGPGPAALPATLAVEMRSPGETMESQRRKCRQMRANGVDICWLVDPVSRHAERFEGDADAEPVPADGALESRLLPGLTIPLADLWAKMERAE
jgi:Uma2 family endonuclease